MFSLCAMINVKVRSVKLAMGSKIDIQLCIGRHSLRISSYEIDIQLCIQLIIRGI